MRAIMVAHECGIPQWHWEVDNKEELLKALRAAQEKAKDISHARAVAAVQETEPSPILKKFAEVVLVVRPTIRNVEETPADEEDIEGTGLPDLENEDPLLGDEAWRMFVRILTKKPTYFTHFSTEAEMVAISLENPRLQEFLDPYITGGELSVRKLAESSSATAFFTTPIMSLVCAVFAVANDYIRAHQVRGCLPRLASGESFMVNNGVPAASIITVGAMRCAIERLHWKQSFRTEDGTVNTEENNVFFAIVSDEGESSELLLRLVRLVKEATDMAAGSIARITMHGGYTRFTAPQPALGCVVRALLHSLNNIDIPSMSTQGVVCLQHFSPYPNPIKDPTTSLLLDTIEATLRSVDNVPNGVLNSFAASTSSRPNVVVHCLVFVNSKLVCCHTRKGNNPLTATDVFLLSSYVQGIFVGADGKAYDPGHGSAWDPFARGSAKKAQHDSSDAASYVTDAEVQQAEVVLSEYGINRLNYKSKEGVVKARLMTLQRHNMGTKARKLQQAWSVLVSYGMQKSGGDSMLAEGGGNAEDSDLSDATPEDTQLKPRKQPSNFSFSRPISPSSLVDGSRSRLTGPVRAAFDGIHHMSGASRDIAWFDGMGAEPESREKAEGEADGDSTAVPVDELFEEGTVPPGEPYAAQQNVQEKQAPSLPSLRVLHLQQRPQQEERRPFAVFVDNLANDLSETEESLAKKRAVEIEQKFGSIRICLVEELTHNKANGTVSIQPEEVLPRMQRLRNTMRSQLTNILDYITTLEKTHFNLVASGTYLEQCPGLVHFVLIDRTAHNRVISPLIVPMRAEGIDGFRQFSAELQSATEEGLLPRLRQMFNTAHLLVKKGFTEGLWGDSSMQYYHKIWIESDGDEIAIDQDILSTIQVRPWAIKDHLEALGRKSVKCYELYVMYLGIIPPKAVEDNNKALLSILLPQNDRSNTQSREY